MGTETKIEWCDKTFTPWVGCTRISPACDHCYAAAWAERFKIAKWGPGEKRVRTSEANWLLPLKWDREAAKKGTRTRVFCASLADVFDNEVPVEWRRDLFALIDQCRNLDWLVLTKRIGNARDMLNTVTLGFWDQSPWQHVWLGATICNQEEADRDIPKLLDVPASVRFLSIEPMLSAIDLSEWLHESRNSSSCTDRVGCSVGRRVRSDMASSGRLDADQASAGGHRPASGRELPQVAVHVGRKTVGGASASSGVDGDSPNSYTGRTGDQPQGWRPGEQHSNEPRGGQSLGECDAQFQGSRPEGEGSAWREEHQRETQRSEGSGDSRASEFGRDAAVAGGSVRRVTAHDLGGPDAQDLDARPLISWVIVGGESGPHARPSNTEWLRSLRDQCDSAEAAFFVNQMGGVRNKRGALDDIPDDLRIRRFPS